MINILRKPARFFPFDYFTHWGAVIGITMIVLSCSVSETGGQLNHFGQNNAIWAESIYLRGFHPSTGEKLTDEHVIRYAKLLRDNHIKYVYLFAGPFDDNGNLPDFAYSDVAIRTVALLSSQYKELVVLPWVGGIQDKTVHLEDDHWRENALRDTKRLLKTLKVPGIHLDFEFILRGNSYLDRTFDKERPHDDESYGRNVNEFHAALRKDNPDAFVSAVVACTSSKARQWKRKTSFAELSELTKYVDQLSFLFYDTSISTQTEFELACREQLLDIYKLRMKTIPGKTQFLLAIGTFINLEELHGYRNLKIERVDNSLATIRKTIGRAPDKFRLDGIAIFCDWETVEDEWLQFREGWIKAGRL